MRSTRRGPRNRQGQGLVEYALVLALVAIGLMAVLVALRNGIGNSYNTTANRIDEATGCSYADGTGCPAGEGGGSPGGGQETGGGNGNGNGNGKGGGRGGGNGNGGGGNGGGTGTGGGRNR